MGLLKAGKPKTWEDSKKNLGYIRKAGVRQFIATYNRVKDLKGDELLWGDEIEYGVFMLDHENKKIRLSIRAKEVSNAVRAGPWRATHDSTVPQFVSSRSLRRSWMSSIGRKS